jgi:hypothetical protein
MAGSESPVSILGTESAGGLTTSGTETCSGRGSAGGVAEGAAPPTLVEAVTGADASLRTGVEPVCTAGGGVAGSAVELTGEESRTDVRTTLCGGETTCVSFVPVTGLGVMDGVVS